MVPGYAGVLAIVGPERIVLPDVGVAVTDAWSFHDEDGRTRFANVIVYSYDATVAEPAAGAPRSISTSG